MDLTESTAIGTVDAGCNPECCDSYCSFDHPIDVTFGDLTEEVRQYIQNVIAIAAIRKETIQVQKKTIDQLRGFIDAAGIRRKS